MSYVQFTEAEKIALGELVIEAALSSAKRLALEEDPKKVLGDIGVTVPDDLHIEVVQNKPGREFLVIPDRQMVKDQLKSIDDGNLYGFPPGYEKHSDETDQRKKYNYRVGDYVLAQCG